MEVIAKFYINFFLRSIGEVAEPMDFHREVMLNKKVSSLGISSMTIGRRENTICLDFSSV